MAFKDAAFSRQQIESRNWDGGAVEKAFFVIPAKAGIQNRSTKPWIPAFAGMTKRHTGAYLRLFQQPHRARFRPFPAALGQMTSADL
jgi:predicted aminopeptidase